MDFKSPLAGRYVRIVAIIALLLGLSLTGAGLLVRKRRR